MAGVFFRVNTSPITGSVPFLIHAFGSRLLIHDLHVSIKGIDATAEPILAELWLGNGIGTNNGTLLTPVKLNQGDDETLQLRAFQGVTIPFFPVEQLCRFYLNQRGAQIHRLFPDLFPLLLPVTTGRLAVFLENNFTLPALVSCGGEE